MSVRDLEAVDKLEIEAKIMPHTPDSTKFDTLTAVQTEGLKALVEGLSVTAAAERR